MNGFNLSDCDSIYVDSVVARFSNLVEVRGAVYHPGQFELGSSISSVRDLIEAADGVREDAFLNRAVMHREKPDMTLETRSIDIKGLLDGTVADIPLRNNDVLFIPSMTEMNSDQTLSIEGEVNFPGVYVYSENTTLEDFVLQAGGLTQAASMAQVNVYRRIRDPKSTVNDTKLTETFSFALNDDFEIVGGDVFTLKPFDQVVIRKSPAYNEQQNVSVNGAVNFQGSYIETEDLPAYDPAEDDAALPGPVSEATIQIVLEKIRVLCKGGDVIHFARFDERADNAHFQEASLSGFVDDGLDICLEPFVFLSVLRKYLALEIAFECFEIVLFIT